MEVKSSTSSSSSSSSSKPAVSSEVLKVLLDVSKQSLSEDTLASCLQKAVDKFESDSLMATALERAVTDSAGAAGKRRRLFITPDSLLSLHPLPVALTCATSAEEKGGLERQGSLQSVASAVTFADVEVVDLTTSCDKKPSSPLKRSFLASFPTAATTCATASVLVDSPRKRKVGVAQGETAGAVAGSGRWVEVLLPVVTSTAAASADKTASSNNSSAVTASDAQDGKFTTSAPSFIRSFILIG